MSLCGDLGACVSLEEVGAVDRTKSADANEFQDLQRRIGIGEEGGL